MGAGDAHRPYAERLLLVRRSARGVDRCRPRRRPKPGGPRRPRQPSSARTPEVGSSGRKSTAHRAVSGAPPAALENPEDRIPSTPGRTHNRIRSPRGPGPEPVGCWRNARAARAARAGRRVPAGGRTGNGPLGGLPRASNNRLRTESKLATGASARRPPRPTLGRSRPKGPCHWLSPPGRRAAAGRLEAPFPTGGVLNPLQTT
uniref:Uncharacterized protein n=1 Tax=Zea mays TaxID=4577 RepID=A0A804U9X4_MAIZE